MNNNSILIKELTRLSKTIVDKSKCILYLTKINKYQWEIDRLQSELKEDIRNRDYLESLTTNHNTTKNWYDKDLR